MLRNVDKGSKMKNTILKTNRPDRKPMAGIVPKANKHQGVPRKIRVGKGKSKSKDLGEEIVPTKVVQEVREEILRVVKDLGIRVLIREQVKEVGPLKLSSLKDLTILTMVVEEVHPEIRRNKIRIGQILKTKTNQARKIKKILEHKASTMDQEVVVNMNRLSRTTNLIIREAAREVTIGQVLREMIEPQSKLRISQRLS